jgi:hypothetical protein
MRPSCGGQLGRRRRFADLADELLEAGRLAEDEPAAGLGLDPVRVRHAARRTHGVARLELDVLAWHEDRQPALDDVEDLVLAPVDVERGHVPLRPDAVDDGVGAVCLLAVDQDAGDGVDEPERLGLGRDHRAHLSSLSGLRFGVSAAC